jgi:hypothetical protein
MPSSGKNVPEQEMTSVCPVRLPHVMCCSKTNWPPGAERIGTDEVGEQQRHQANKRRVRGTGAGSSMELGRMRADRQKAAANVQRCRQNTDVEAEAVELADQIDGVRQQAEDLRVEIEMAISTLMTVVTSLSAVATGAVMQLQSIKHRVELFESPATPEPDSVPELPTEEPLGELTSRASRNGNTLRDRLANYTVTGSGCHEWNGPRNLDGYGMLTVMLPVGKRQRTVHRLAWKAAHGEIPHGKQVRHRCGNRACINVEHLELVPVNRSQSRQTRMVSGVQLP